MSTGLTTRTATSRVSKSDGGPVVPPLGVHPAIPAKSPATVPPDPSATTIASGTGSTPSSICAASSMRRVDVSERAVEGRPSGSHHEIPLPQHRHEHRRSEPHARRAKGLETERQGGAQVVDRVLGAMLRRQDGRDVEPRCAPVDRRGEHVVASRGTEGHDSPRRARASALENALEFADLVAAVHALVRSSRLTQSSHLSVE